MAGYIFGVSQGDDRFSYELFKISEWDGYLVGDFIPALFTFVLGASIFHYLRKKEPTMGSVWGRIFKRTFIFFAAGFLINFMAASGHIEDTLIMGPLQRTALVYLFVAINVLVFHKAIQRIVIFAIFGVYIGMMYGLPVPDFETDRTMIISCGRGILSRECNAAGWIDRQIFRKDNMIYPTDPYGFLITCSAIATCWCGVEFGRLMDFVRKQQKKRKQKDLEDDYTIQITKDTYAHLFRSQKPWRAEWAWGLLAIVLSLVGGLLTLRFPLNWHIWSFPFAILSAGLGGFLYGLFFILLDKLSYKRARHGMRWPLSPFVWLGINSFTVFVCVTAVVDLLKTVTSISMGTEQVSVWEWLYINCFVSWLKDKYFASFFMSAVHFVFWLLCSLCLDRLKWYLIV